MSVAVELSVGLGAALKDATGLLERAGEVESLFVIDADAVPLVEGEARDVLEDELVCDALFELLFVDETVGTELVEAVAFPETLFETEEDTLLVIVVEGLFSSVAEFLLVYDTDSVLARVASADTLGLLDIDALDESLADPEELDEAATEEERVLQPEILPTADLVSE